MRRPSVKRNSLDVDSFLAGFFTLGAGCPPEVLGHMLTFASGCRDDLYGRRPHVEGSVAMSLRLVCREWKDILDGIPAYWAWLLGAAADDRASSYVIYCWELPSTKSVCAYLSLVFPQALVHFSIVRIR